MTMQEKLIKRGQNIAKSRGDDWRLKLSKGKLEAIMRPSILRLKRVKLGKSQTELGKVLGLSLGYYGNIERGLYGLDKKSAIDLSKSLKSKVTELFEEKDNKFFAKKITS